MSEYDDDDGGMPAPDWGRYAVKSRAYNSGANAAVGDPLRWGGVNEHVLQAALVRYQGPQFLRAQAADTYGRLWALTGTVSAAPTVWALGLTWQHYLEVTQGSGQATIIQLFDLRLLTSIGLSVYARDSDGGRERRSFAIIGGVVGQSWSARILGSLGDPAVNGERVTTSVISSVLAAGTGL